MIYGSKTKAKQRNEKIKLIGYYVKLEVIRD